MSYQNIGCLVDKWLNDTNFRNDIRKSPEEAVRKAGVQLSPEEWKAFKTVDWSKPDAELKSQISKGM